LKKQTLFLNSNNEEVKKLVNAKFQALINQFTDLAANPHKTAKEWSLKTGKKVVACAGLDVPEPLIEAAGMMPIVLLEEYGKPIELANAHVQSHMCGYVRSMMEQALNGTLNYVEALLIRDACHELRMIGDLIHYVTDNVKHIQFMYFPPTQHETLTKPFMQKEMAKIRKIIGDYNSVEITDEMLAKAIKTHNENRKLMIRLYDIRRGNPGIISAVQVSVVIQASMCMPKEEHSKLLQELIAVLEEMANDFKPSNSIPIIVSGSLCEICKDYVLEAIESTGGVVIDDDLYVGSRYFNTLYDELLAPMDALIEAYVNPISPCPTKYEKRSIGDYQLEMLQTTGARAIVDVIVQNCEAHYYGYFMAHQKVLAAGRRDLDLFIDMENDQFGQVKTRLQSFFESLEGE